MSNIKFLVRVVVIALTASFAFYNAPVSSAKKLKLDKPVKNHSDLDCTTDQIAKWDGNTWVCADYPYGPLYTIGKEGPAGGIVFYISGGDGTATVGAHGFEAAPKDFDLLYWGCQGTKTGASGIEIGTGRKNTAEILVVCIEANIAAKKADDYQLHGYTDWFLPSKDELNLMWKNLARHGLGGFTNDAYWSSSEVDSNNVWVQNMRDGISNQYLKDSYLHKSRAMRVF